MSDTYENNNGVHIRVNTDKNGKDHISFYDRNPRDDNHESIHINWDSNTGKGNIVESNDSGKSTTDTSCFLTTACIEHFKEDFDDNCYELTVLRWFRDNFVSKEDVRTYYEIAPIIVKQINKEDKKEVIYDYIYENVVLACVESIEAGDYNFAYNRYKNSILSFEEVFIKNKKILIKTY